MSQAIAHGVFIDATSNRGKQNTLDAGAGPHIALEGSEGLGRQGGDLVTLLSPVGTIRFAVDAIHIAGVGITFPRLDSLPF